MLSCRANRPTELGDGGEQAMGDAVAPGFARVPAPDEGQGVHDKVNPGDDAGAGADEQGTEHGAAAGGEQRHEQTAKEQALKRVAKDRGENRQAA